jgi:hypothetical protein
MYSADAVRPEHVLVRRERVEIDVERVHVDPIWPATRGVDQDERPALVGGADDAPAGACPGRRRCG